MQLRRTVAVEIAACELRNRIVARTLPGHRTPLVEQRVGELLPATRAAADHGVELGLHDDVRQPLYTVGLDAGSLQDGLQFLARELSTATKSADHRSLTSAEDGRVEFEPAVVGRHG